MTGSTHSFRVIKERLETNLYGRIQHLPSRRSLAIGNEPYVFTSFFRQTTPCIFHSTCFYGLYHFLFKRKYPRLYDLYKAFFLNEAADKEALLGLFTETEIDDFLKYGIVKNEGSKYRFNFRFVPFERLFLVAKSDIKDVRYAHLNYDSVTFIEFIRKMRLGRTYDKALEIGCGAGLISLEIAKIAGGVDAIDINPYALELMGINAELNGVRNISPFLSDCYANINEKYDLIVSDPPFELMPEGEKKVLHRYGGHLGMDVALKIFAGFDGHLKDDGEAIVFTISCIKNFREDTLREAILDMFKDKKYSITLHTLSYQINPDFYSMYRKYAISYSVAYVIHMKRADSFSMVVVPLRFPDKIREALRVIYLYLVAWLKKK